MLHTVSAGHNVASMDVQWTGEAPPNLQFIPGVIQAEAYLEQLGTGLEATTAIRKLKDPAKAGTTIIAMTASILKKDIDHYMKKGMDGYVPKPFKVDQLLSEIERAHLSKK